MKKERKRQQAEYERTVAIGRAIQDGFESVISSLEQKGFNQMVKESFIVPCNIEYKV